MGKGCEYSNQLSKNQDGLISIKKGGEPMTLSKLYKMSILVGIFAMFFAVTPAVTMAGGGPEPGGGDLGYVGPPFIGDVTITYNAEDLKINIAGMVRLVGNPKCKMKIDSLGYIGSVTQYAYDNLMPYHLRQRVLERDIDFSFTGCDDEFDSIEECESVGAANLKYDVLTESYTAYVVIMRLQ